MSNQILITLVSKSFIAPLQEKHNSYKSSIVQNTTELLLKMTFHPFWGSIGI